MWQDWSKRHWNGELFDCCNKKYGAATETHHFRYWRHTSANLNGTKTQRAYMGRTQNDRQENGVILRRQGDERAAMVEVGCCFRGVA